MKNYIKPVNTIINIVMAVGLFFIMNAMKVKTDQKIVGLIVFLISNQIILTLLFKAFSKIFNILKLKNAKYNTYAYHLWPLALISLYAVYIVFMLKFGGYSLNQNIAIAIMAVAIVLTLASQLGGAIADKRVSNKKYAVRLENAGGVLGGFEILGSMTGTYEDGIIVGFENIPYASLDSMHRSSDSVIIEGAGEKKTEIILISEKAKKFFTDLLAVKLNMPKREIKKGLNFKKPETSKPSKQK